MTAKHILGAVLALYLLAPPATAGLLNVDLNSLGGATHSGSNGALSTTGSRWNGVPYNVDAPALVDEFGAATAVSLVYLRNRPLGPFLDFAALNNLQNDGMTGEGFEIRGLDPNERYTLAVYSTGSASFNLLDAAGNHGGSCANSLPTYVLPGTEGSDYCRFADLVPFQVAPGVYGIRLSGLTGSVTGLQILGTPPPDLTAPACAGTVLAGTPGAVEIHVQDTGSGLASIQISVRENVSGDPPAFALGTHDEVAFTLAQVDPYQVARVEVTSEDVAGNVSTCTFEIPAGTPPPPTDTEPPSCSGTVQEGPPASLRITVSDGQSGLASISLVSGDNVIVSIPPVSSGTTEAVVIEVTKADIGVLARIEIASSDVAGNSASCTFEIPAEPVAGGPCENPEGCCEETMGFFANATAEGNLGGNGPGKSGMAHRRIFERQLERICELIGEENFQEACNELAVALRRVDGQPSPDDFVVGPAAPQMAERIRDLQTKLDCSTQPFPGSRTQLSTSSSPTWSEPVSWGLMKTLYDTSP